MAELTVQEVVLTGLETTFVSADVGGDTFSNDGRTFLWVDNASGGDITVTLDAVAVAVEKQGFGSVPVTDTAVVVTAGEERLIGPLGIQRFNTSDSKVAVTYSGVTSLTVAAVRLPLV